MDCLLDRLGIRRNVTGARNRDLLSGRLILLLAGSSRTD